MKTILKILAAALLMSASTIATASDKEFNIKGMHIDMRAQVMSPEGLKTLADKASANGLNTLIMEWAGSFPFEKNAILRNKYSFTENEVREFISYCQEKGIDVIPLQNCFGHADYILDQPRYAGLIDIEGDHSQICACKIDLAMEVMPSIFEDVIRLHPSKYIHIGGDEVHVGCSQCKAKIAEEGMSKVYTDYIKEMCKLVSSMGKTPVIWGDMLLHHPEAIDELPEDLVIIDWHYYNNPKPEDVTILKGLMESGHKIWAGPSLRCWPDDINTFTFCWGTHFDNIRNFIPFAREMGYDGAVMTSWSTGGHYANFFNAYDEILYGVPIRQAYPLEGVDILQDAYAAALKDDKPQDTEQFIRDYCGSRFGLNEKEQEAMIEFFLTPQRASSSRIPNRQLIDEELANAYKLQSIIYGVKFKGKRADRKYFNYLRLMADIRVNYLQYSDVYCDCQAPDFTSSMRQEYATRLKPLIKQAGKLAKRFKKLTRTYLQDPGDAYGNWGYVIKMKELYLSLI